MKDERKRILKMVEDGSLRAEEALLLLEELEKASKTMEKKEEKLHSEWGSQTFFEEAKKQQQDTAQYKFHYAKEKIIEFVDTAFQKIKDADLDFNFGPAFEISHVFQQNDVRLSEIEMEVANGKLTLIPWEQNDVRIDCRAKVYRGENHDEARQNFLRDVLFTADNGRLLFSAQQKWMKVEAAVYIPKEQYDSIRIRMFNGPVEGSDLAVKKLKVKSANGKISLEKLNGSHLEAEAGNGQITVTDSTMDHIEAETVNGAIKVAGDYKSADLQSFNGNIQVHVKGDRCERLEAEAVTGTVDVYLPSGTPVNGDLRTNLGGFQLELDGIQVVEEKSEMVQKMLRFQSVKDPAAAIDLRAKTKTGSIAVKTGDFVK
ncbi:DUF4097 family beta strand repeat-containing protein [Bacillus infantis]|uniref:DUF4097 family beta strand repeat-containing protein n=1 Tax=Bacillus infantis TaxID=324767 RepID=UPI003CF56BA1